MLSLKEVEEILPGVHWEGAVGEEDLLYIQYQFICANHDDEIVQKLLAKYSVCPELVVSTILLIHERPADAGLSLFPYCFLARVLRSQSLDGVGCVEGLCERSESLFVNLLYRGCLCSSFEDVGKARTVLEILAGFGNCRKYFARAELWGLERERVGVSSVDDEMVEQAIRTGDLDVSRLRETKYEQHEELFSGSPEETLKIVKAMALFTPGALKEAGVPTGAARQGREFREALEDPVFVQRVDEYVERVKGHHRTRGETGEGAVPTGTVRFRTLWEYSYPCFLVSMLTYVSKDRSVDNRGGSFSPLYHIHKSISDVIKSIIGDHAARGNFEKCIENVCSQDRHKIMYDKNNNCDDDFVYNLACILLYISEPIFTDSFISKIGDKKFPTFGFFYSARLLRISLVPFLRDEDDQPRKERGFSLYLAAFPILSKYTFFVFSLIDQRLQEVFSPLLAAAKEASVSLDALSEPLDVSFDEKQASRVDEILLDETFLFTVLILQTPLKEARKPIIKPFVSLLFTYKNTLKVPAVRALFFQSCQLSDQPLVKRLTVYYAERGADEEAKHFIRKVLRDEYLEVSKESLKMVNLLISDMESTLSSTFKTILDLKEYQSREEHLSRLLSQQPIEEEVSDEEAVEDGTSTVPLSVRDIVTLNVMTDPQRREYLRRLIGSLGLFPAHSQEPRLLELQAKLINDLLLKHFDQRRYRTERKRLYCQHMASNTKQSIKALVPALNNHLEILLSFTRRNRTLFLNRNIFSRFFRIMNGSLSAMLNTESKHYRLSNPSEFDYNPKDILRSMLQLLVNLLGTNRQLIMRSSLDAPVLARGLSVAESKYLLGSGELSALRQILSVATEEVVASPDAEAVDVPERFIDPITCDIMEQPVRLLTSRVIMDRSTFNQILLSDSTDPFSRLPLDESKAEPDRELEAEIRQWAEQRRSR